MDPLSTSAALLSVLTIMEKGVDFAQKFKKALVDDSNFSIIYFTLMSEKRKYEGWANNMRLVGNQIHPDDLATVIEIKDELDATLHKAVEKFVRYGPVSAGKAQRASAIARMKWISGDSDEIKDLLRLIRTLNESLGIVAPVLPPYTLPGNVPTPFTGSTAMAEVTNEPQADSPRQTAELSAPLFGRVLWKLFDTCLNGLNLIGLAKDEIGHLARSQTYRLRLWGTGLFEDTLSLEELLYASRKHTKSLYTFLLDTFVDMAITEEQILGRWASDASRLNRRALDNARMQLTAILGAEEVVHSTMKKWQVMLEEEAESGKYSDKEDIDLLQKTIGVLYDVLPAIRSVRREYVLGVEVLEMINNQKSEMEVASVTRLSNTDAEVLVEKNLEQVGMIEQAARAREAVSKAQGLKIQLFSKRIAKTRLRLEEWKLNLTDKEDTASKVWKSQEVGKIQSELSTALARFTDAKSGKLLTEGQSSLQLITSSEKGPLKPEGLDLDPGDLENLVNQFDMAVSHLITTAEDLGTSTESY